MNPTGSMACAAKEHESAVPPPGEARPSGLRKLIVLLILGAASLVALHFTPLGGELRDLQALREKIDGRGIRSEAIFFGIASLLIAVGTPRLIFFALGGLVFGFYHGCAVALAASMAGSFAAFRLIRWGGRQWVRQRFGGRRFFRRITTIRPTVLSVCLVRQLPISNVFINATLALSSVRSRTFLLGSLLGFLPQGAIAALIGSGALDETAWEGVVQLAIAALVMAGFGLWTWYRSRIRRTAEQKNPAPGS